MSVNALPNMSSVNWFDTVDPTSNESEYIQVGNFWTNTVTGNFFICFDATPNAMVWYKMGRALAYGQATLVLGSATVNTTAVTASSIITLGLISIGGTSSEFHVGQIVPGVSFRIVAANALNTSTVSWQIS